MELCLADTQPAVRNSWVGTLGSQLAPACLPLKRLSPLPVLQLCSSLFSLIAQLVKNLPAMQETWVRSLGWEDPQEKGMATHSSILAWRIAWTIVHGVAKSRTGLSGFHFHFTVFPVEATPLCFQGSGSQKQQVSHARSVCSGCLGWGCKLSTTSQGVSATGVPVHFDLCWLQTAEDGRPGRTPPPLPGACPCISPSC